MDDQAPGRDLLGAIRRPIADLPPSQIVAVANYGRERQGLLPLWFGEGDLPTPGFIADAAIQALRDGQTFYTYQRGIPPLRQALSAYLGSQHGVPVDLERVIVTNSGMQAIVMAMQMLIGPGDELVVVSPVWPNIFAAARIAGGTVRPVALDPPAELDGGPEDGSDGEWRLDLDRLFDACGPRTRAIFVNSPSNPTGWILPRDAMAAIRDFARARGLWIVADEVYGRLVFDDGPPAGGPSDSEPAGCAPSFLEVCDPEDRLIVVNSFSKNWCMTGWRIGWIVIPAALGDVAENLVQFSTSGTPAFLQHGAVAALTRGEDFVRGLVARCRKGRDLVCDRLAALPNVTLSRPPGAFYAFFAVAGEADSMTLARRLIDEANVGLAPGSAFGPGGERYLRLCFAGSHAFLEKAMDRLVPVLGR